MSETLQVVCPHCHTVNRVPRRRLGERPKCGKCKGRLFSGHPVELSTANFDRHIKENNVPVLVDFWAPWCGPCRTMAPEFQAAADRLEPGVRLAKVNTEDEPALGARFDVRSIPTLVLYVNGAEAARQPGAMRAPDIVRWTLGKLS